LLEKENQGDLQSVRDVIEATGSDAVGAVLIVLELLTGNAECVGQLLLRHAEQQSAHPQAGADMRVDGVGGSVREHDNLCRSGDRLGHRIHLICVATPRAAEISTVSLVLLVRQCRTRRLQPHDDALQFGVARDHALCLR
jgi:hypothetical protein